MARKWYDYKAGEYIEWYVDNGTRKPLEVWLDGRLFRIVEPNDYVTKNYHDSPIPKFLRPKRQHTIEIRTISGTSVLETCSFVYPYDETGQLLASGHPGYAAFGNKGTRYFIYNIHGANTYNVVRVEYGVCCRGDSGIKETIRGERRIFVRLDGVYWSINDVPKSIDGAHGAVRYYLLLRS